MLVSDSRAVSSGDRILPDMQEEKRRKPGKAETAHLVV